jgi:hypothetical protein
MATLIFDNTPDGDATISDDTKKILSDALQNKQAAEEIVKAIEDNIDDDANKALSNLDSTAVNTDILPDADDTHKLGESGLEWAEVHSHKVKIIDPPVAGEDGTNKTYVDSVAGGVVATGTYVGDGIGGRLIVTTPPLPGPPKSIIVGSDVIAGPADAAMIVPPGVVSLAASIPPGDAALAPTGFTVAAVSAGPTASLNAIGTPYHWTAFC